MNKKEKHIEYCSGLFVCIVTIFLSLHGIDSLTIRYTFLGYFLAFLITASALFFVLIMYYYIKYLKTVKNEDKIQRNRSIAKTFEIYKNGKRKRR